MNITSYLKKFKNLSFKEKPFSEVDSLILAQLSYFIFDDYLPKFNVNSKPLALKTLNTKNNIEVIVKDTLMPKKNVAFFKAILASERFSELKINYYKTKLDDVEEVQFAAMTFIINPTTCYIAFRGTDITILGWKEDFNMSFLEHTPGQLRSSKYLNKVIPLLDPYKTIYVGGHSKGGNLALYSSIYCKEEIQNRISAIYDHDGPGFKKCIFDTVNFKRIENRLFKTIPRNSLIGIILNHSDSVRIVKANAILGILQHSPFSWQINSDGDFICYKNTTKSSQRLDKTLSTWLESLDDSKREKMVEDLFFLFETSRIKNVTDFKKDTFIKLFKLVQATNKINKEDKKEMGILVNRLAKIYFCNLFQINSKNKTKKESFPRLQ